MKYRLLILIIFFSAMSFSQTNSAFKNGEWLKYKLNYGIFNAGAATLQVDDFKKNNQVFYHIIGKGWTNGLVKLFFKVDDNYQTFINKKTMLPYHFRRRVYEGGYTKKKDIYFNQKLRIASVIDHKHKTHKTIKLNGEVQDLLSALYFLRNKNLKNIKVGDEIKLETFFDNATFKFRLRVLGKEVLNTKFGKINTVIFRPLVQKGRVFKEKESVTVWISDDENKIPLLIKAKLAVGSLKAELAAFKGLAHSFPVIFD